MCHHLVDSADEMVTALLVILHQRAPSRVDAPVQSHEPVRDPCGFGRVSLSGVLASQRLSRGAVTGWGLERSIKVVRGCRLLPSALRHFRRECTGPLVISQNYEFLDFLVSSVETTVHLPTSVSGCLRSSFQTSSPRLPSACIVDDEPIPEIRSHIPFP